MVLKVVVVVVVGGGGVGGVDVGGVGGGGGGCVRSGFAGVGVGVDSYGDSGRDCGAGGACVVY